MAKQKFDREVVIEQSEHLFWHQGYRSCSIQDIVKATGLKPGSIYNSFGNKETLYGEALERYTMTRVELIRNLIDGAPSIPEGFCRFLQDLVSQTAEKDYSSCFLIKTQFEISSGQGSLHNQAVSGLEKVEEVIREYLSREYGDKLGRIRATSVMLHINGIRVYGYRKSGGEKMLLALQEGLSWLPWDKQEI